MKGILFFCELSSDEILHKNFVRIWDYILLLCLSDKIILGE